jgi:hypothetical protein
LSAIFLCATFYHNHYAGTDQLINEDIQKDLDMAPFIKELQNIKTDGNCICKGWDRLAFHFKPMNIVRLVDESKEDLEEGGRRRNNIRGRNRHFG